MDPTLFLGHPYKMGDNIFLHVLIPWNPQQERFLANLCLIPRGKGDNLRDYVVEKWIPFLGLCRLIGRELEYWDGCRELVCCEWKIDNLRRHSLCGFRSPTMG
jgi:hypothetical protein